MALTDTAVAQSGATDYSQSQHWISVPSGQRGPVDVFYLYPTAWTNQTADPYPIAAIDNPEMLERARSSFNTQATAFSLVGNLYAPYYRQVDAASALGLTEEERKQYMEMAPIPDALAAFEYYLDNYNQGRPFILAGHSQGAEVLSHLLEDYFDSRPELMSQMVAAYVLGYSITEDYLAANPGLSFAEGGLDFGKIISWNTEAGTGVSGPNPVWLPGSVAINPLNWSRDDTYAGLSQNLGSLLVDADGKVVLGSDGLPIVGPALADAQVDTGRGTVKVSTVDPAKFQLTGFPTGAYHSMDIPFFYVNLMVNALDRSDVYLSRSQAQIYPAAMLGTVDMTRAFKSHQSGLVGFGPGGEGDDLSFGLFASPFGQWTRRKSEPGRLNGYDIDGGGFVLGGQWKNQRSYFGLAAGFSRHEQKMKDIPAETEADIIHLSLFGGRKFGSFSLEGSAAYARAWNDTSRRVDFASFTSRRYKADYKQDIWSAGFQGSYTVGLDNGLRLRPSLGIDVVRVKSEGLKEKGPAAAMRLKADDYTSWESTLGLTAEKSFDTESGQVVTPFIGAAWITGLNSDRPGMTASFSKASYIDSFAAEAARPDRSLGRISLGLKSDFVSNVRLEAQYDFDFSSSYRSQRLSAGIGFDW